MAAPEPAAHEEQAPIGSALTDELARRLDARTRVDGAEIVGWRFDFGTGWSLQAGMKDGRLGGPYEPPAASRGSGGGLYLRWSDGACSYGTLDVYSLADWDERLAEWRAAAYVDPDEPEILPPPAEPLPQVRLADQSVDALVDGDPSPMIEVLVRARRQLQQVDLHRVDADSGAGQVHRFLRSSSGLRVSYPASSAWLTLSAEDRYGRGYSRRRWPSADELDDLIANVADTTLALRQEVVGPTGEVPVLLRPGLATRMIGAFVIANLNGSAIDHGRAAFGLQDFRDGRQVARDDFDLVVDTLLDLDTSASPISPEGVPGGRATLIERGRLRRPIVGLKYARRTGFPPTPVPSGSSAYSLRRTQAPRSAAEVRAELPLGVELNSVLGLSGQETASGRYALVAAQALVIQAGRPLGRAKVALTGSFFDHLCDERTELVAYPWGTNPGLLIWTRVERQA